MADRLPSHPIDRAMSLLHNALPQARRPLPEMPAEAIADLLEARNLRAETFASMEDMTDRCRTLSEELDETGVIVDIVDSPDDDSLVHHIDVLKVAGRSGS